MRKWREVLGVDPMFCPNPSAQHDVRQKFPNPNEEQELALFFMEYEYEGGCDLSDPESVARYKRETARVAEWLKKCDATRD